MPHFEVRRTIQAAPAALWSILTDATRLASPRFGIDRIEGRIAPGSTLKLVSQAAPNRAFALKVTRFELNREMVWEGGMPFGLFRGVRRFTLTPDGAGTRFVMREDYTGPLVGLIWKSMPDLGPFFETFADGLEHSVESVK